MVLTPRAVGLHGRGHRLLVVAGKIPALRRPDPSTRSWPPCFSAWWIAIGEVDNLLGELIDGQGGRGRRPDWLAGPFAVSHRDNVGAGGPGWPERATTAG